MLDNETDVIECMTMELLVPILACPPEIFTDGIPVCVEIENIMLHWCYLNT